MAMAVATATAHAADQWSRGGVLRPLPRTNSLRRATATVVPTSAVPLHAGCGIDRCPRVRLEGPIQVTWEKREDNLVDASPVDLRI